MRQTPLVGWHTKTEKAQDGIFATRPVPDPLHELAPLGRTDIFKLPDPPAGVTAGR